MGWFFPRKAVVRKPQLKDDPLNMDLLWMFGLKQASGNRNLRTKANPKVRSKAFVCLVFATLRMSSIHHREFYLLIAILDFS